MSDYIKRKDALKKEITVAAYNDNGDRRWLGAVSVDDINDIPAADVEPVVRGEWIFRNCGSYSQTRAFCSACGKHSGIGGIRSNQAKPFCPNCGAHMREKPNE